MTVIGGIIASSSLSAKSDVVPVFHEDLCGGGGIVPCVRDLYSQGRRLRVASGATAPGPALEGALRFRPMSLSSYILR